MSKKFQEIIDFYAVQLGKQYLLGYGVEMNHASAIYHFVRSCQGLEEPRPFTQYNTHHKFYDTHDKTRTSMIFYSSVSLDLYKIHNITYIVEISHDQISTT